MARISKIFNLNKDQYELDFVDIDPNKDTMKFIDPYWISKQENSFAINCDLTIKNFFTKLIGYIKNDNLYAAEKLCSHLGESGDVCLGYSSKGTVGSGMGILKVNQFIQALSKNEAIKNDVLVNIEDIKIFIENIGPDNMSDMIANIIRKELITYTQIQCNSLGIPMKKSNTHYFWNSKTERWERESNVEQLIINNKKILLVPKTFVMDEDEYTFQNFIINYVFEALKKYHLDNESTLIEERKNGEKFVTKKAIKEDLKSKYGPLNKDFISKYITENPEIFNTFKKDVIRDYNDIDLTDLLDTQITRIQKSENFIENLKKISPGKEEADNYHDLIFSILVFILGNNITMPSKEVKIHEGRKRIDIAMLNNAKDGVLFNFQNVYKIPAIVIYGECKNYSSDVRNPEIDQLSGRFSPMRTKVGFLLIRNMDDRAGLIKRCKDTYVDDRGLIIPLCDSDIVDILNNIIQGKDDYFDSVVNKIIFEIVN